MTAAAPAARDPEPPGSGAALPAHLAELRRVLDWTRPGALEVNRTGVAMLRALEGRTGAFGQLVGPTYDPELRVLVDPVLLDTYRRQIDRATLSREAAAVAGRDTFTLPIWPPPSPSLDTRQQRRRHKTGPRLSEGVKARQRDRYKRAMADALTAFAHEHRPRRTIDRDRLPRPRWLDHRASCTADSCRGCRQIVAHAAPRWHRSRQGLPRRDYLEPVTMRPTDWLADRAAALRGCREAIGIRDLTCGGVLVLPQSCNVRTCPDCEQARQVRVVDRYTAAVEAIPGERARFVTFTIRNVPRDHLAAGIDHLRASAEKLRRRALWKGGRCRDRERCRMPWDPERPNWRLPHPPVAAALQSVEVTYNAGARSWHPHLHAILDSAYLDQGELADTWEAITGDSRIVDVRAVATYAAGQHAGDTRAALRELLKYAAKPTPAFLSERDPAPVAELLLALRGRRMTSATGYLVGLDDGELEPAEGADGRPLPVGPSCALLVLVQPDNPDAEPYRAPRTCPMHGGLAEWRVTGYVPRQLARKAPARAGPHARILTLPDPGAGEI